VLRGKGDDARAVEDGKAVREDDESVELLGSCGAEGRLELLGCLAAIGTKLTFSVRAAASVEASSPLVAGSRGL